MMIIGKMYIGGIGTAHINIRNNVPAYTYRKVVENRGKAVIREMTIKKVLANEPWDYVSLLQISLR